MKSYKDIPFKTVERHDLYLDIYLPDDVQNPPLVMWIHGGGWMALNRDWNLMTPMLERGYAVASVDYRYIDEAPFPAQMYDLKDALVYLKEHAAQYGYDASNVVVSGDSAGAHLAAMVGVSVGHKDWEQPDKDYSVGAVVSFSGPFWLAWGGKPEKLADGEEIFNRLVGGYLAKKETMARAAEVSPITYIDGSEPPFLLLTGTKDPLVDDIHSIQMCNELEEVGVPVHHYSIPGGDHGLAGDLVNGVVAEFLDYYIKGKTTVITPEVLPEHERTVPLVEE